MGLSFLPHEMRELDKLPPIFEILMVLWKAGGERCVFRFPLPFLDNLPGLFTLTQVASAGPGPRVGPWAGRIQEHVGVRGPGRLGGVKVSAPSLRPTGARLGWGASSPRPTLGAALAGRGCPLHNCRPGNAAWAVPTGLPAQGGTPSLAGRSESHSAKY